MPLTELRISDLRAAVVESGRVVWSSGTIRAAAPEEPVIAERVPQDSLDNPAPISRGATIRQVLTNTADGTPGEEVLGQSFILRHPEADCGPWAAAQRGDICGGSARGARLVQPGLRRPARHLELQPE